MSKVKQDNRVPQGAYVIANLGNVVVETAVVKHAQELHDFARMVANGSPEDAEYFKEQAEELIERIKLAHKAK